MGGVSYQYDPPLLISKWKAAFQDEYVMLFRMHAFTTEFKMEYDAFARDMTEYHDLNDLLIVADVVVTDYSTIVYDCAVAGVPFLCFGYDYDSYRKTRGFYYDLDKVYPCGVLYTEDQVIEKIREVSQGAYKNQYIEFRRKYIEAGGNSTNQIIEELVQRLRSGK